ncbi:MAG: replication-associated recombination protein A [Planctomycetes bacterium]|nr:replication-associated recombination protein A [Planctomycetota bacterium]
MSLFTREKLEESEADSDAPLAHRMRPRRLDEFVGQQHFLGPGKLLWRMIEADRLSSVIFYGPPGTGKTALARILATTSRARFEELNAAASNVAEVKAAIERADEQRRERRRTLLFLDEIHRFNKAQQDVLLPAVEKGVVLLVGATTHNPFFSIVPALVSRSQIFEFRPLSEEEVCLILRRACGDVERGLGGRRPEVAAEAVAHLARVSDGDARRALNALELAALTTPPGPDGRVRIGLAEAEESIQKKAVLYDRDEDAHYDVISAYIKSIRGSDPDAAVYWLARMLEAGEDPRFIARRLVICAAEDIGNAAPYALAIAQAAAQAAELVGMPEARIPLAQATLYLATSPKSNSAIVAIDRALEEVRKGRLLEVPQALRDAHYGSAGQLGRGAGYQYAHDFEGHFVPQEHLPAARVFYEPSDQGHELEIRRRLEEWRKRRKLGLAAQKENPSTS